MELVYGISYYYCCTDLCIQWNRSFIKITYLSETSRTSQESISTQLQESVLQIFWSMPLFLCIWHSPFDTIKLNFHTILALREKCLYLRVTHTRGYQHVTCEIVNIKTFGQLHDLYFRIDVILSCVFEDRLWYPVFKQSCSHPWR